MRQSLTRVLARHQRTFATFTSGQKVVAVIGTMALLLAGFMVFRWAASPSYSPLFSNMSPQDASAVIEQLESQGVPYELSHGGATVMVPRDVVHETRISLSGEGLPSGSEGGYALLDEQTLSASQFQEQTAFKRAMEGELAATIGAIDGVRTAVVHLALPEKQVFADEQAPTTASVLVDTQPGTTFGAEQVQAVVHLVASSVDGLEPEKVTVADSAGRVLSADDASGAAGMGSRNQQVEEVQDELSAKIRETLDRVVGPGNSAVTVTAQLDFDKAVTESTTYTADPDLPPLSENTQTESYTGPGAGAGVGGVVGPDGQMDSFGNAGGDETSAYEREASTRDNAVDATTERREKAPGSLSSVHVGVVLDAAAAMNLDLADVRDLIAAGIGTDDQRGDTIEVSTMPFDRSVEEAAAAELAAAEAAAEDAEQQRLLENVAIAGGILLVLLLAWWKARRKERARVEAATYVVEQLRNDAAERTALAAPAEQAAPALQALETAQLNEADLVRDELIALVEQQPEDVAALLRGWLVER